MRRLLFSIVCLAAFTALQASSIVYTASLEEFVASRDAVFKGVVRSVRDIDQRTDWQIATIEILEVLKNEKKTSKICVGGVLEVEVPSTKSDIRLSGRFYHDPGTKGIWILSTISGNFGIDDERSWQPDAFDERIRVELAKAVKQRANKTPLPTPVECPLSNHDQLPGAADL